MKKTALVGAHHKTGTMLAMEIVKLISETGSLKWETDDKPISLIPNQYRKLPLSRVLQRVPRAKVTYSIWFEHEIDMPEIAFLHFVRNPWMRIASGYLYHRRGAPSDQIKWVDWAIFEFHGQKRSYREILNELSFADGVVVEAIRTYPEAVGTAHAFKSSLSLPAEDRLIIWLDEFEDNPTQSLRSIFDLFFENDPDRLSLFLSKAKSRNIVLNDNSSLMRKGHVTKTDENRTVVEKLTKDSQEINFLYEAVMQDMNISSVPMRSPPGPQILNLLSEIKSSKKYLMLNPEAAGFNPQFWNDRNTSNLWQMFTLSNFGCGHLMMYPFVQRFIASLS